MKPIQFSDRGTRELELEVPIIHGIVEAQYVTKVKF